MSNYPKKNVAQVKQLELLFNNYKVIGLTKLDGVSSNVLQNIRGSLRGDTEIKVAKNTLKKISMNKVMKQKPKIKNLLPHIKGNMAIIFSNRNPFSLQQFFNSNKVDVQAKPGQITTNEVWVSGGLTDMSPGPVIGDLNSIGIRTSVDSGKVKINSDTMVLKAGDEISETHASILGRLGIKPISMGISLYLAMEESGELLFENDLNVDTGDIMDQLLTAWTFGVNLSLKSSYPTIETINSLLAKANTYANNLCTETAYPTAASINRLLSKASSQAVALSNLIN